MKQLTDITPAEVAAFCGPSAVPFEDDDGRPCALVNAAVRQRYLEGLRRCELAGVDPKSAEGLALRLQVAALEPSKAYQALLETAN